MKKILVMVEGGLGKHIIFTALTEDLKKKYEKVVVASAYFDIMKACPFIDESHPYGQENLSELVYEKDCTIVAGNPYHNQRFIKKEIHILEAWAELLGIPYDKNKEYKPLISPERLGDGVANDAKKVLKEIGGKFILVQFYGGQTPLANGDQPYQEILKRNYHKADVLVQALKKKYPKFKIVNFSLKNEPDIKGTIKLEVPYLLYIEVTKKAEKIVCIDSSLQHIAAAAEKNAIVLWGETRPEHFGWKLHYNMVVDDQKGSPYFVALGPSPMGIDFPRPAEVVGVMK